MISLRIPDPHPAQMKAIGNRGRYNVFRCGRRWGKTQLLTSITCQQAIKGKRIGWFAPEHKFLAEPYRDIISMLNPVLESKNRTEGSVTTTTGGQVDVWSLENELAGRGRKYHTVILDEIAFGKDRTTKDQWEKCIEATLMDFRGSAYVLSTPKGINEENWFYQINEMDQKGMWTKFHSPTTDNPYISPDEIAEKKRTMHPDVYRQEILAEFVDWSGIAFFSQDSLLVDRLPVPMPQHIDEVFAVVDTAIKTGKDNDGTAVVYFGRSDYHGHQLTILDWDIQQIEGSLLEVWIPNVHRRMEELASLTAARYGAGLCHIEDKGSGTILLQQSDRRGMPNTGIANDLTAMGKDERAISVSGYVFQGKIKITDYAFNKTMNYKGIERNHFLAQVCGFRPGDKDAAKRADDLLDCFCYGMIIALGNPDGY